MCEDYFDLDLDDRIYMEESCFRTFIAPEQADILLMLYGIQEAADNAEFERKFGVDTWS